jgi:hypothetical protein
MFRISLVVLALLTLPAMVGVARADELYFSRDQAGGAPPFFDVTVAADGRVVYREALDDEFPLEFQAPAVDVSRLFEISKNLGYFADPLPAAKRTPPQSGHKVLRYTSTASETHEVQFVYSPDEGAQELVAWFAKVAETERYLISLERSVQFDRLGVNDVVQHLDAAFGKGRVIAPRQFLPLLQKVVNDLKIIHLARSRAAGLMEQIEAHSATTE